MQGEVRLNIEAGGNVRLIYQFVHELRQKPEFRVLRMSGGPKQKEAVWLGVADGTPLKSLLSDVTFVSKVNQRANPRTGGREGLRGLPGDLRTAPASPPLGLPAEPGHALERLRTEFDAALHDFRAGLPDNRFAKVEAGALRLSKRDAPGSDGAGSRGARPARRQLA